MREADKLPQVTVCIVPNGTFGTTVAGRKCLSRCRFPCWPVCRDLLAYPSFTSRQHRKEEALSTAGPEAGLQVPALLIRGESVIGNPNQDGHEMVVHQTQQGVFPTTVAGEPYRLE